MSPHNPLEKVHNHANSQHPKSLPMLWNLVTTASSNCHIRWKWIILKTVSTLEDKILQIEVENIIWAQNKSLRTHISKLISFTLSTRNQGDSHDIELRHRNQWALYFGSPSVVTSISSFIDTLKCFHPNDINMQIVCQVQELQNLSRFLKTSALWSTN